MLISPFEQFHILDFFLNSILGFLVINKSSMLTLYWLRYILFTIKYSLNFNYIFSIMFFEKISIFLWLCYIFNNTLQNIIIMFWIRSLFLITGFFSNFTIYILLVLFFIFFYFFLNKNKLLNNKYFRLILPIIMKSHTMRFILMTCKFKYFLHNISPWFFISFDNLLTKFLSILFKNVFIINLKNKFVFWALIPSIFIFIFLSNLIGLIPYSNSITSYLFFVFLYASLIFLSLNIAGIFIKRWTFFSIFYAKGTPFILAPFLCIIEFISYISRVVSLTIRLFANIVAGHLLLKVLGLFIWKVFPFGITSKYLVSNFFFVLIPLIVFFLLIILELFVSFIQAYIFTLLLTFYINESINFVKVLTTDKKI